MLAHWWPVTLNPSNHFRFPFLHKLNKPDVHRSIKIQYLYYLWLFSYLLARQGAMLQISVKLASAIICFQKTETNQIPSTKQ